MRAVEALYNIAVSDDKRYHRSLSVQHLVNNVNFDVKDGIGNTKNAFAYIQKNGVCSTSQWGQLRRNEVHKAKCRHGKEVEINNTIDCIHLINVKYLNVSIILNICIVLEKRNYIKFS